MPLSTFKKNVLLSTAISAATLLTACGGGGGGGAVSICATDYKGASEVIIDGFEGGALTGRVEDGSLLKTVTLTARDGSEQTKDFKDACESSFTLTNIPQADALTARDNDSEADYTLTVVNGRGETTVNHYLAPSAKLKNMTAVQLNESAFSGPKNADGTEGSDGLTHWLQDTMANYDIEAYLKKNGKIVETPVANALPLSTTSHGAESLSKNDPAFHEKMAKLFTVILEEDYRESYNFLTDNHFHMYIVGLDFNGEAGVSGNENYNNNAELDLAIDSATVAPSGFDVKMTVSFAQGLSILTKMVVTDADEAVPALGMISTTFVVPPSAKIELTVNVSNGGGMKIVDFTLPDVKDEQSQAFVIPNAVIRRTDISECTGNLCSSGTDLPDLSVRLFNRLEDAAGAFDLNLELANALESALGENIRVLLDGQDVDSLSKSFNPEPDVVVTVKGEAGEISSNSAPGGFISMSGSVELTKPGVPVEHVLGSYFETDGSSAMNAMSIGSDSGVVIALSEAMLNQTLLATYQSGTISEFSIPDENVEGSEALTAGDLKLPDQAYSFTGIEKTDELKIDVRLDTVPYLNIGKSSGVVDIVMGGMVIDVTILGSGEWNNAHVMTMFLSPKAQVEYGILGGVPKGELVDGTLNLDISKIDVVNATLKTYLKTHLSVNEGVNDPTDDDVTEYLIGEVTQTLEAKIKQKFESLASKLAGAKDAKYAVLDNDVFTDTLPKTAGIILNQATSDSDGKVLLLKGDLKVKDNGQYGFAGAIYNIVFCSSSELYCVEDGIVTYGIAAP